MILGEALVPSDLHGVEACEHQLDSRAGKKSHPIMMKLRKMDEEGGVKY
jgi:hypothetical protein